MQQAIQRAESASDQCTSLEVDNSYKNDHDDKDWNGYDNHGDQCTTLEVDNDEHEDYFNDDHDEMTMKIIGMVNRMMTMKMMIKGMMISVLVLGCRVMIFGVSTMMRIVTDVLLILVHHIS